MSRPQVIQNPDAFATTLLLACTDLLQDDDGNKLAFLDWDPETIYEELKSAGGVPPHNFNKLITAIRVVTTDDFQRSLPAFIEICDVLYDGRHDSRIFDPAGVDEVAWALIEATLLWPPDDGDTPFHPEILAYIEEVVKREGYVAPPDAVLLALPELKAKWGVIDTFTDDPDMYAMTQGAARQKTDEANAAVTERLQELLGQLANLQAIQTDTGDLARTVLESLRTRRESDTTLSSLI